MEKLCIVLGAGASHDVVSPGSNLRGWRMPLTHELFTRRSFLDVLGGYKGARFLKGSMAPKLSQGDPVPLEELLRGYANHPDRRIRERFKEVPPYLRDVIKRCAKAYSHGPETYFQLVGQVLAEHPH